MFSFNKNQEEVEKSPPFSFLVLNSEPPDGFPPRLEPCNKGTGCGLTLITAGNCNLITIYHLQEYVYCSSETLLSGIIGGAVEGWATAMFVTTT